MQQNGGVSHDGGRSTPACSLVGSDWCRNTDLSQEGEGMRSYLYQSLETKTSHPASRSLRG